MSRSLAHFESIARRSERVTEASPQDGTALHPFETNNVHEALPKHVRTLFDNGHYSQAIFEALKFLDKKIHNLSKVNKSGFQLMMDAFGGQVPKIALNDLSTESYIDEQGGYQFIFAGAMRGIRNPRGHDYQISDSIVECLDCLVLVSMLMRKLEAAGYSVQ